MAAITHSLDTFDLSRRITVKVALRKWFRWRIRTYIGTRLIRLGVWMAGCRLSIETDGTS
jgi:hypothetical protein